MPAELPPAKRHVATHDASGKSVYADLPEMVSFPVPKTGAVGRSWAVSNIPVKLGNDEDIKGFLAGPEESVSSSQRPEIVIAPEGGKNNGANLLVIDLSPGGYSVMHQTVSIDFSICTAGSIIHELDSGERVTLKPGDHIVQRGTKHRWMNASTTEPARFIAVTLPCEPFEIAGEMLTEIHTPDVPDFQPKL